MKYSLVDDLSKVTNIPTALLDKMLAKIKAIICDDVLDAMLDNESIIDIDVGIGTLSICTEDNKLKYRFTPLDTFNDNIIATISDLKSPVKSGASRSLASKIQNAYEELL